MSYMLFVRADCPACKEVKTFLERTDLEYGSIDLDKEPGSPEASYIHVVPALFQGKKLMAYGTDIITYLASINIVAR